MPRDMSASAAEAAPGIGTTTQSLRLSLPVQTGLIPSQGTLLIRQTKTAPAIETTKEPAKSAG